MECLSPVGRTLDDTKFLSLIESNVKRQVLVWAGSSLLREALVSDLTL